MLPYVISLDVLSFYFGYVHGLLKGHQYKGAACVTIFCVIRLCYKIVKAMRNNHKRGLRKEMFQQKHGILQTKLSSLKTEVDLTTTKLSFQELCQKVQGQDQSYDISNILLAFQVQALSVDVTTNAVVELIPPEVTTNAVAELIPPEVTTNAVAELIPPEVTTNAVAELIPPEVTTNAVAELIPPEVTTNAVAELIPPENWRLDVPADIIEATMTSVAQSQLLNIPVSLAEVIHVQSLESTAGLSCYLQLKATEDAVVVQLLKLQGAIPFIRTNVPQAAFFSFGSSNPIFGVTRNPFGSKRSPGGTNSGEAVLVSTGGSVLGVGTDIAGGLRIPAHFCGICGFKPTSGRISNKGVTIPAEGQDAVATCIGPLSVEVAGLVAFMASMCVPLQHQLDPTVSMMTFNQQVTTNNPS